MTATFDLGRGICNRLDSAESREWLITNGIGGYGMGTIAGTLTRGYHSLLIAALNPPLGRTLLVAKVDDSVRVDGTTVPLFANRWDGDDDLDPHGYVHLDRFHLEGTTPVWTFAVADAVLEKRIWMEPGANTTYVRYDLLRGTDSAELSFKALVNYRDYHGVTHNPAWQMAVDRVDGGLRVVADADATPLFLLSDGGSAEPVHTWIERFFLPVEAYRGEPARHDHLHVGTFRATLAPGGSVTFVATTDPTADRDGHAAYGRRQAAEQRLLAQAAPFLGPAPRPEAAHLVLAADQFIVARATPDGPGHSVLAGFPWFTDWGRDTMIALPGLTLTTGRPDVARSILKTFSHFVSRGMIPNRFPDAGEEPEYNTVDATLWYFEALRAYHAATGDDDLLRELWPTLVDIVDWHRRGTRYRIGQDAADGLLSAGEDGVQLTWMDAKVEEWVVTPRIGKPVEINALWYNALRIMVDFAGRLGVSPEIFGKEAARVRRGFGRYWSDELGYLYDVLDGPDGHDPALRPNQLFAVALPHSPLSPDRQAAVVAVCARRLLTPHGLRSLAPSHPDYHATYGGARRVRDAAYHQGTVWGWLIGPFVAAHLRVHGDPALARSYLEPLLRHLADACVGQMSEIFDGDAPFTPRGCSAQAWTVAELLRLWQLTQPPA